MGLFSNKLSSKSMVLMCRQLATSYTAGIPILRSLQLVASNVKDPQAQRVLRDMYRNIREGDTLAQAARKQETYLPRMFIEMVQSGELGGKLDLTLRDLAGYYEERLAMRRSIIQKMTYPGLQLVCAWFLGTFALMIIRNMSTKGFSLSAFIDKYLWFQAGAMSVVALAFLGSVVLSRAGLFGYVWGLAATYLWPLAPVTRRFAMSRFFRSLSFLIGSGMPIARAIEGAAATASNPYIEKDLLTAIPRVKQGMTLSEAFAPCKFFTNEAREMLLVGEESGKQEEALRRAADFQMEEAMQAVAVATRVGEVVIILAVAAVIGYIVISFWMSYFKAIDDVIK